MGGPREAGTGKVRLLICDDHRVLTDALVAMVRADGGFDLIAPPLHDPAEAVEAAAAERPDVVLMDISFEGSMTGIDATRAIRSASPETSVVIMTAHHDAGLLVQAAEAGASGYLSKTEGADRVLSAAKAAAAGDVLFEPADLAAAVARVAREREADGHDRERFAQLTDRERDVLALLTEGCTNGEIAARLFISDSTVQMHVGGILAKLGVRSRTQAVALALRRASG
jgi:DNA-binding NarL/FixJ family response regulator